MWKPLSHWLTEPQIAALLHIADGDGLIEIVGKADKSGTACNPPSSSPARQAEVLSRRACWRGARGLAARGRISYPQT